MKNTEVWGRTDSWAETLSTSKRFVKAGTEPSIGEVIRRHFIENVEMLRQTFDAARRLATGTRPSKLVSPATMAQAKPLSQQ